jgi:ectonucleotide pyrophosphatase/phosphodiesterase family member 6
VISIDSFRWDYLNLHPNVTMTFRHLIENGVTADYLKPVFPTVTTVNQYSLVTGLYPESNRIIGNVVIFVFNFLI